MLYNSYCVKYNKNICMICEKEHDNHEIISFNNIIPNKQEIKNKIKK